MRTENYERFIISTVYSVVNNENVKTVRYFGYNCVIGNTVNNIIVKCNNMRRWRSQRIIDRRDTK